MTSGGTLAWAALAVALGLGCASVPWKLDPEWLRTRLNDSAPMGEYRWEAPARATLRLFPTPLMDVYGLKLVDGSGKVAFEASAAAFGLSAPRLLLGRYVVLRARLKDPTAEIDLDALAHTLPALLKSPPAQVVQARGGRLRFVSRRLGFSEELSPVDGALVWEGRNRPLHATFGGVWRGRWANVDASLASPADFLAGLPSDASFDVSAAEATAKIQGSVRLGGKPGFTGSVAASVSSLAAAAAWLGLDGLQLASAEAEVSGKVSASPAMLSLDEGSLDYENQKFEGTASLMNGAGGWSATATLATERLDLAEIIGPPPEILTSRGDWSEASTRLSVPSLDFDLRLSANSLVWGGANFVDAALALRRQAGKATLEIIEAGYGGGGLNGEIDVDNCASRCEARARLTLANADLGALTQPFGWNSLSGRASGELDVDALGDTPASLIQTARGELRIDAVDGAIQGLNFEEALRRSQRRPLDIARDLAVGRTAFSALSAKLTIADGVGEIDGAQLGGPGVRIAATGRVELAKRAWMTTIGARQADAQGAPSPEGATLDLELRGPWAAPRLTSQPHED